VDTEGAAIADGLDRNSRNEANISKFREPLPPVVTSIEGSGYVSDSSTSDDEELQPAAGTLITTGEEQTTTDQDVGIENRMDSPVPDSESVAHVLPAKTMEKGKALETQIPAITISQASPPPTRTATLPVLDVPGGFPDDPSDISATASDTEPEELAMTTTHPTSNSARTAAFGSTRQRDNDKKTIHAPATILAAPAIPGGDDSESSIYSDAYEDLSELEGDDGFLSLDAVVDSPIGTSKKQAGGTTRTTQPTLPGAGSPISQRVEQKQVATDHTSKPVTPVVNPRHIDHDVSSATTAVESQTQDQDLPGDEWEKAKAFWRSLTVEKRAQLEREAREDAGIEADLEETRREAERPKKKKTVERRASERKALAVHMAQQMMADQQKPGEARTYMIQPGTRVEAGRVAPRAMAQPATSGVVTGGKAPRPTSLPASSSAPVVLSKGHNRRASEVASQSIPAKPSMTGYYPPAPLRRRGSTSSESSFKRTRTLISQGFGFRKTLRQPSGGSNDGAKPGSSRFSLRSLSSAESVNRPGPPVSMSMRQTLRGSSAESKGVRGLGISGFGKKPGKTSTLKSKLKGSKKSNRFGDSSDEEDAAVSAPFRSRFDDSSDEGDIQPQTLHVPKKAAPNTAPTRGAAIQPALTSPRLPEEDEISEEDEAAAGLQPRHNAHLLTAEEAAASRALKNNMLRRSRSGRGGLIGSQSAPAVGSKTSGTGHTRRSSLMAALRRKRPMDSGIQRAQATESAARRDTKLERTIGELRGLRQGGPQEVEDDSEEEEATAPLQVSPPAPPRSPRLQKRTASLPLDMVAAGQWPFTPTDVSGADGRWGGVDAAAGETTDRRSTSLNLGTRTLSGSVVPTRMGLASSSTMPTFPSDVPIPVASPSLTGDSTIRRKKKFASLRKMFGLLD
jgi:hypothetical protein